MKRIASRIIPVVILILLLSACSSKNGTDIASLNGSGGNKDESPDITIQSPMTLSNNDLYPVNGQHQYLRLKMVNGKYYEDWAPGAYMGTIWEGYFILELSDESGNVISQNDLSKIYKEPLIFNSSFQIQFDDYNGDGDIDFTIGQYASGNGRDYKLFTIRKDGKIEELPVKDHFSLFISNTTGFYSTKLTKIDNVTFKIEYYNNSKGKNLEDFFRWDENKFVRIYTEDERTISYSE
mgnify:CR=1 FL=1